MNKEFLDLSAAMARLSCVIFFDFVSVSGKHDQG
jgi:hypothetical protein